MKIEFSFYDGHLKESNEFVVNLPGTLLYQQIFQRVVHILYRRFCAIKHMEWNMTAVY